jgi:YihY family inner membrane protein
MENDLTASAAAVSYFAMLALFPTLLLLLTAGNQVLGPEAVERYVLGQVVALLPGAQPFIRKNLESITGSTTGLIISCAIVMLWAISWMFTVVEKALNRIWGARPRSFFHGRAVNFALMSLVWVVHAASAGFMAVVSGLRSIAESPPLSSSALLSVVVDFAWNAVFILSSASVTIILFTALFKWLPNAKVKLSEALPGAVLAGVLWEAAKYGFAYLLPFFHYELLYGSIAAAIALLSWVYLSSLIMLFGAQFTAMMHR